jgi:short-subunit dehydrogenase
MPRQTAFITGASSGIGAAFARRLARDGYDLVLHGRREHLLADLCKGLQAEHGIRAEYVLAELSEPEGVRLVRERLERTENLALLINNAGSGSTRMFHQEEVAGQAGMVQTHVIAAMHLCHVAIPRMNRRGGGAIINVSSIASFTPGKRSATYCAAKSFLTAFSEALHLEVGGDGIRIQALCPGFTTTDFHSRLGLTIRPELRRMFMSAEAVVEQSLEDLKRGIVVSVPGWRYRAIRLAARLLPRRIYYILASGAAKRAGGSG